MNVVCAINYKLSRNIPIISEVVLISCSGTAMALLHTYT
jgi:hypothetical protein